MDNHSVRGNVMRSRAIAAAIFVICLVFASGCARKVDLDQSQYDQFDSKPEPVSELAMQFYRVGTRDYQTGDCAGAVENWNKALDAGGPDWTYRPEVLYNVSLCYVALNRESWAIVQLQKAIEARPDFYNARFSLANLYVKDEKYDEAAEQFAACTRMRPEDPALFYSLGICYLQEQRIADAVGALSTALFLGPAYPEATQALHQAYRIWGVSLYSNGMYKEAAEKFGVALSIDPTDGRSMYDLARCYLQTGQFEQAIQLYRRAHELAPELAEEERNALAQYARKSGKSAEFHIQLGDVYASRGQNELAADQYEKAIAANPDDTDRYLKLARFYADILNDRDNAVRWYGAFLVAEPSDARVAMVRKEIAKETAPPPDPNRKPAMVRVAAGTEFNQGTGWVEEPQSRFSSGTWVYRVIEIEDLWGEHVVIKRMIRPDGKELYVENITKEFYVDRFTFVSRDRLGMRGTWRQEWVVDGETVGTLSIQVQ